MAHELTAVTEPGVRMVALAEALAYDLATRAGHHDREATYPHASIDSLRDAGYFAAPLPAAHGGLGAESTHDVVVASSRLARGDASVAIGVNMHMAFLLNLVRRRNIAQADGNARRVAAFDATMEAIARGGVVLAAAASERGQDLARPRTTATRTASGWRIDGTKVFCTMSPAATALYTTVTFAGEDGVQRYGYAHVPVDTPGVEIQDDWDALGMRASGSHSVSFTGVEIPAAGLRGGFPIGDALPFLDRNLNAGLFHAAASLGIAESAHGTAVRAMVQAGRSLEDSRAKMLVAESTIDLSAARASLSRAAALIDAHHAANPASDGTEEEVAALFTEAQAAKAFIGEACARVVDRALALSGGAGYLNGSPLARAYRDVRASAFMHPLGANRAYEWIARHVLGLEPSLA